MDYGTKMAVLLSMVWKSVPLFLMVLGTSWSADSGVSPLQVNRWAESFGSIIVETAKTATQIDYLKASIPTSAGSEPKLERVNGTKLVHDMKVAMEEMLSKKVSAIQKLVGVAEKAYEQHENKDDLEIDYPKAKDLNTTAFELEENEHFNYIPVNLNQSTVHVPTNVYDESSKVLNDVAWSEALDPVFRENYEKDPTLTWQYFGSADGPFRNYPGIQWNWKGVDLFDCRTRGWYIQAATSPKDIIILLDTSGSMTGLRMEIARATVEKILDTLSDDDFFNVIKFSTLSQYVDPCFNKTLVQANADNKKRIKHLLKKENITTQGIANFETALDEGFEVLQDMHDLNDTSGQGAQCNRAIMLITDGAPETYEELFAKHNWPEKNVRVFTYLIGREVKDSKQVYWMACANKGYFSHISTLADVHEHVQEYIHVLSRPMVINRDNNTIWTSVYLDAAHEAEGLRLMTSVAQPVFDTKNETLSDGVLLGVMGTDVPLKELMKLTPVHKLGVNGYAFAITNNGYILFHPDFRPTQGDQIKPNYNSVDLAEVELSDDDRDETDDVNDVSPNYNIKLRQDMIDRKTGNLDMEVKVHYDNMKRVTKRTNRYYFTDIKDTPFSLGIAIPKGYGMHRIKNTVPLKNFDMNDLDFDEVKIADWNYCRLNTNETRQDPVIMLTKYLRYGQDPATFNIYNSTCDNALIEQLLYDAAATKLYLLEWLKVDRQGTMNNLTSKNNCTTSSCTDELPRHGIELVFCGTKSGLTRYHKNVRELTHPEFLDKNRNTIEALYYKRAVENGDQVFTFSVPHAEEIQKQKEADPTGNYTIMVTASSPIEIIGTKNRQKTIMGVAGLQMRYEKFYEFFMNTTSICNEENCKKCENESVDCFLLDEHGFVVLSEDIEQVGMFFGEIHGLLMQDLLMPEEGIQGSSTQKGIFKVIKIFDYQGICEIWESGVSSATSIFVDPIRKLFSSAFWMVQELALFLIQFNLFSWWNGDHTTAFGNTSYSIDYNASDLSVDVVDDQGHGSDDNEPYYPNPDELAKYIGYEQTEELLQQITSLGDSNLIKRRWEEYKTMYEPRVTGYRKCINNQWLVKAKMRNLPQRNTLGCDTGTDSYDFTTASSMPNCTTTYSIDRVPNTNLMLLVMDGGCNCANDRLITIAPEEVKYTNDTMSCGRIHKNNVYRRRPAECFAYHKDDNATNCGGSGNRIKPSIFLLFLSIVLYVLKNNRSLSH